MTGVGQGRDLTRQGWGRFLEGQGRLTADKDNRIWGQIFRALESRSMAAAPEKPGPSLLTPSYSPWDN